MLVQLRLPLPIVLALVSSVVGPASTQRRPGLDTLPSLVPGQRVRVCAWDYGPHVRPRAFLVDEHQVCVAGELVTYEPPAMLRVRRTGLLAPVALDRERTFTWDQISHIDRPNGRNVVGGAVYGFSTALATALLVGLGEKAFGACGNPGENKCQSVLVRTARYSIVAVPVGALAGYFFTRWKRVY